MTAKLLSLYGLKYNPFGADLPVEALYIPAAVDVFLRRVEVGLSSGGFAMLTGDPGTGKTTALRLLASRLEAGAHGLGGLIERREDELVTAEVERNNQRPQPSRAPRRRSTSRPIRPKSTWAIWPGSERE